MQTKTSSPELLMPAGDPEKMRFAFAFGADAVYAGVPLYSLRARGNGFNTQKLKDAIEYTHKLEKKIYLTMNIYAHNTKVDRFLDNFCEMADWNPDGFIMTDIGLINKARKLRPNAIIHLSTQANASNWTAVEFWRDFGIKRVILSRELSLKEISTIHEKVPDIELETFVHGAICIAYSGRCLISNYLSHRDANQGTCTNSCRWEYKVGLEKESLVQIEKNQQTKEPDYQPLVGTYYVTEAKRTEKEFIQEKYEMDEDEHGTYMMNSKDLCAIELLGDLRNAGICSFKSEGRTKSIYFVAVVSRAYRRAIDDLVAGRPFNSKNLLELMSTANRTLMTGFLTKRPNEYGENIEDGLSDPLTHRYAGQVKDFDSQRGIAWVDVRNKLTLGDTIEWITPTETYFSKIDFLLNKNGSSTDVAHGGIHYGIPCPIVPTEYTLLRLQLNDIETNHAISVPTEETLGL